MSRTKTRTKVKPLYVFASSAGTTASSTDLQTDPSQLTAADLDVYMYGEHSLKGLNKYQKYQRFTDIDPYVHTSLEELGLTMGKGYEIGTTDDAANKVDGKTASLEKMVDVAKDFSDDFDMRQLYVEAGFLMGQDGTIPIVPATDKDGAIDDIIFLPMAYTTILPVGVKPEESMILASRTRYILKGNVETLVLNEGYDDVKYYNIDEVELIRNMPHGYYTNDILNRPTIGLYGRSLLECLDTTIKYRQNIIHSYEMAVMRYGHLKLWFEYKILGDMLANHSINIEDAKKVINSVKAEISKIKANEDIVTSGFEINPIQTDNSMNIIDIKKSLEGDIANTLCSTEAGSGKGAGTTFASAYMAENRKILVMESMRKQLRRAFENILKRHLEHEGYGDNAKYIRIKLDPIVEPEIAATDLKALFDAGLLNEVQLFDLMGITATPQPKEYQDAKKKEAMDMQKDMMTAQANARMQRGGESNPQKAMLRDNPQKNKTTPSKTG